MMQMTAETQSPPIAERRPLTRKRTLLGCAIVFQDGARSIPCTIRNITANGAQLGFAAGHVIPAHFWLINRRDATAHQAHTAWVREGQAGVEFQSSLPLHRLPAELGYLKRFAGR